MIFQSHQHYISISCFLSLWQVHLEAAFVDWGRVRPNILIRLGKAIKLIILNEVKMLLWKHSQDHRSSGLFLGEHFLIYFYDFSVGYFGF